jgi:hypothetical protein
MTAPHPRRYLEAADNMLRGAGTLGAAAVTSGWWPKACACLIRLALEGAVDAYWQHVSPPVARYGNGRTKLLMLRRRISRELAREATYTWATLSRATHHHCYETSISAGELRRLLQAAEVIVTRLAVASSGARWNQSSAPPISG